MADIYVDADLDSDSGSGTVGDPYGDHQYALNQTTQGASGDTFWINGSEVLAVKLDFTSYGDPAWNKPCVMRGWDGVNAQTDGDGDISGAGSYQISDKASVSWYNLELHNSGSNPLVATTGYHGWVGHCEVHNSSGDGIGNCYAAFGNHVYDCSGYGVSGVRVHFNYLANGTKKFSSAIRLNESRSEASHNIISIDGASNGITTYASCVAAFNSILANAGQGYGIGGTYNDVLLLANLVEGFSGAGGDPFYYSGVRIVHGHNAYYNCANSPDWGTAFLDLGNDESLASSPFAKSGNDTVANRFTYFEPNDVGNVRGGAYPSGCRLDKGAVQHSDPAGGGGATRLVGGVLAG